MKKDFVTAQERLNFTTTGTRPYRGPGIEEQRAELRRKLQEALDHLGDRWLLHPIHAPQRLIPPGELRLKPDDLEPDEPNDDDLLFEDWSYDAYCKYQYDPEPRG